MTNIPNIPVKPNENHIGADPRTWSPMETVAVPVSPHMPCKLPAPLGADPRTWSPAPLGADPRTWSPAPLGADPRTWSPTE